MQTFRTVWLLRYLSLGGELCLRDGTNATFFLWIRNLSSLQASMKNVTQYARISRTMFLIGWNRTLAAWLECFPEKPSWCRNEQVCQGGQKV